MFADRFESMLRRYPNCIAAERRFALFMREGFSDNPKECDILISLYDLGIVNELNSAKQIDQGFCDRYKKKLVETYGVMDMLAEEAVRLWCVCYGKNILKKPYLGEREIFESTQGTGDSFFGEKSRNYENCEFSVIIPTIMAADDAVFVKSSVRFKPGATCRLALDRCMISDQVKNVFSASPFDVSISPKGSSVVTFEIATPNKKPLWRNAKVSLMLLSSGGTKYEICYQSDMMRKLRFEYVMALKMTAEDETRYFEIIMNAWKKRQDTAGMAAPLPNERMLENVELPAYTTPTLEKYKKALLCEMGFLKMNGGRKHKVTNGVRLNRNQGVYSYRFELESEMNLADDAPITITAGGRKASGNVLMCEGFEIIITIKEDLGASIRVAYINVEPWKLLEAQVGKLNAFSAENRIAIKLLEDGPKLATQKSYQTIPQGQEIAKKRAQQEDITVIWGPPGTGKTHTMSEIAINFLKQGKTVLVVSHSNISVDGVVKKIAELMRKESLDWFLKNGVVLRYGYVRDVALAKDPDTVAFNFALERNRGLKTIREQLLKEKEGLRSSGEQSDQRYLDIEKRLKDIRVQVRALESKYVEMARLVATTISKVSIDTLFDDRKFDVVMFDEVSMAYVPQLLCAASYAKEHFVAVGDFRQLAPIAQSKAREILEVDLFSYLKISTGDLTIYSHPWLVMLNEQRRMHPDISIFPNRYVYYSLLKDHKDVFKNRMEIVRRHPFAKNAMNMIDLSGTYCAAGKNSDNSRFNILSAIISVGTAIRAEGDDYCCSIGIISPYAAQTRLIRAMLQDHGSRTKTQISCSTVHQFQGSERDVIIFDAVESYPSQRVGWLMSKNENGHVMRLINVAVTRARGKLITIANSKFWLKKFEGTNHTFYRLVQYLARKGNTISVRNRNLEEYFNTMDMGKDIRVYPEENERLTSLIKDIQEAREKVVISIPDGNLDKSTAKNIAKALTQAKANGIRILMKSNDYTSLPDDWKIHCWGTKDAVFPLVMVDDRIIWYGVPDSKGIFHDGTWGYATVCKIAFRLTGKHTIEMIKSLSGLESRTIDGYPKALTEKTGRDLYALSDDENDDGKQEGGLGRFVEEYSKCPKCRNRMKLSKGRSGKFFLKCASCGEMAYLTPDFINWYINKETVRCPIHRCGIDAKIGRYGIYIRCDKGHYIKPDEI